jgi:hypothetical protein
LFAVETREGEPHMHGTEVKEWEALGAYVKAQAAADAGKLPARYNKDDAAGALPRRACPGAVCPH